jgi:hypothetical protein
MNIIKLFLLFNLFTFALAKMRNKSSIYIKKVDLNVSIFRKEKYTKFLDNAKRLCKAYYEESVDISKKVILYYENISDEDKILFEFIVSIFL